MAVFNHPLVLGSDETLFAIRFSDGVPWVHMRQGRGPTVRMMLKHSDAMDLHEWLVRYLTSIDKLIEGKHD